MCTVDRALFVGKTAVKIGVCFKCTKENLSCTTRGFSSQRTTILSTNVKC